MTLTPDSSSYGNNGTFVGPTHPTIVASPWAGFDAALSCQAEDDVSGVLMGPSVPNWGGPGGNFTVECRVQLGEATPIQIIAAGDSPTPGGGPFNTGILALNPSGPSANAFWEYQDAGGTQAIVGTTLLSVGELHVLAADWDGTTVRLYVDGNVDASQASSTVGVIDNGKFMVAFLGGTIDHNNFVGIVDELRISNVARYAGTPYTPATSPFTNDANTIGLWHFDSATSWNIGSVGFA